ncbi:MAG: hypothetical protein LBU07_04970, partial [Coriobacteriales bacterium]|nr:hypothetical protein [Coriobacteriales bacterium]
MPLTHQGGSPTVTIAPLKVTSQGRLQEPAMRASGEGSPNNPSQEPKGRLQNYPLCALLGVTESEHKKPPATRPGVFRNRKSGIRGFGY